MRFDKVIPTERLKPYIKYYVFSENEQENQYKVLPTSSLVIGFQYRGELSTIKNNAEIRLAPSGITGISDSYKTFKNSVDVGTILIYFTETGLHILHPGLQTNYLIKAFHLTMPLISTK